VVYIANSGALSKPRAGNLRLPDNEPRPKGPGGRPPIIMDELIEFVAERIAYRAKKHQIKRELEEIVGRKIAMTTYEQLRRKAEVLIKERGNVSRQNQYERAIAFYEEIIADDTAKHSTRLKAQDSLSELLGLGARFTTHAAGDTAEEVAKDIRDTVQAIDVPPDPVPDTTL